MKSRTLGRAVALAGAVLTTLSAPAADAAFIAGWDFGQYAGPGAPTLDGVGLAAQVSATYSDLDPTFGAGIESTAFGTLFLDGTNGSTAGGGGILIPTSDAVSLLQNLPLIDVPSPDVPFDSGSIQLNEGTTAFGVWQDVSMISQAAVDIVFSANLGGGPVEEWMLELAGLSFGAAGTIDVAWSTDGASYNPFTTLNLGATEQAYLVDFTGTGLDGATTGYFRMSFGGGDLVIDNVGISAVPEPGAGLLCMIGLLGLVRIERRSRRA